MTIQRDEIIFGKYKIIRTLGSGGWGDVYLAEDIQLSRKVAIKHLRSELVEDKIAMARFLREARIIADLKHKNIVTIFTLEPDNDPHFMIMEYAENGTLEDLMAKEGTLSIAKVVDLAIDICLALEIVHSKGIIHRDIKPSNILLFEDSEGNITPKLADFGIARPLLSEQDERLTAADSILGTAIYMAPEQARGESVDARSDIYAMGVLLYEALTGQPPYTGNHLDILLGKTTRTPVSPVEIREDVPDALNQLVMKALARKPENRFQTARDMAEALQLFMGEKIVTDTVAELETIYNKGLKHLEQKEWQEAHEEFTQIILISPAYRDAAERLRFAGMNAELEPLYQKALEYEKAGQWAEAVATLENLCKLDQNYKQADKRLVAARNELELQMSKGRIPQHVLISLIIAAVTLVVTAFAAIPGLINLFSDPSIKEFQIVIDYGSEVEEIEHSIDAQPVVLTELPSLIGGESVTLEIRVVDEYKTTYIGSDLKCRWAVAPLGYEDENISMETHACGVPYTPSQKRTRQRVSVLVESAEKQFKQVPLISMEFKIKSE